MFGLKLIHNQSVIFMVHQFGFFSFERPKSPDILHIMGTPTTLEKGV